MPEGYRFPLGRTLATPGALQALAASQEQATAFFDRHQRGDWGELSAEDLEANEDALASGTRILSAYRTQDGVKLWVITEADRSATTMLLPEEY